jgi:hypothetical protein
MIGHLRREGLRNLIGGGHLLNCVLTSRDVDLYFEIGPKCLHCMANMKTPPNRPHSIPTGQLAGTWFEMDCGMIRKKWYAFFIDPISGSSLVVDCENLTKTVMKKAAVTFAAWRKKRFPTSAEEHVTLVVDNQSTFDQFVKASIVKNTVR